jgi:beta-glucosidase
VNQAGLDFYDRLVDELLANGIAPFPTLFHWDTPQPLEDEGGWRKRATAEAFVEYAALVAERLGNRVSHWATHNEPWVVAWIGHAWGEHAPGGTSEADAIAVGHHLLLSHGWAVEALRSIVPDASLGIALNLAHVDARSDADGDLEAAVQMDGMANRWFLDPLFRGSYPADLVERYRPPVRDGDLEAIAAPIDFLGVNNYFRFVVEAGANGDGPHVVHDPDWDRTDMGWEVYPEGLYRLLTRVARDYEPAAIYVTENGAAFGDVRSHDGGVHDPERAAYIASHVDAVRRAADDGAPVQGYFVWSMFDNFEWSLGYSKRFGIVYIDYPTQERVPKDSFHRYRELIAASRQPVGSAPGGAR